MRVCLLVVSLMACGADDATPDATIDTGVPDVDEVDATEVDAGVVLPAVLSETGLYATGVVLAADVREYQVRFPLWTDGLDKRRFIHVPSGQTIDTSDPDEWVFPVGTKLWKEFSLDGTRLETRLFEKAGPGSWGFVSYVWRSDQSDADAAPDGVVDVAGTFHDVPEAARCFGCHRGVSDLVLGVSAFQLARSGFDDLVADGVLAPSAPFVEPPGDALQAAVLGALNGNCGHCHSEVHPLSMSRALRLRLLTTDTLETTGLVTTTIGATTAHIFEGLDTIVVPGNPEASQLYVRAARRGDEWQMPPFGSERVDAAFVDQVGSFINSLEP